MVNSGQRLFDWNHGMPEELWLILAMIGAVAVYTIARVRRLMKQSEREWEQVDKSNLREWEDEDD